MWVGSWDSQKQILVGCCCHETGLKPDLFKLSHFQILADCLFQLFDGLSFDRLSEDELCYD
jgi:hypothetical protein